MRWPAPYFLFLLLVGCTGGTSPGPINQPITSGPNPVPTLNSLDTSCAPAGEQAFNLVLYGQNFVAGSVVRWNGTDRPTASLGQPQVLTAQISASDIAAAGAATVSVFNPPPGGGSSNSLTFTTTTGALAPVSIAVDSAGKFAYVANAAGCSGGLGDVSMYTINPATGTLASTGRVSTGDDNAEEVTVDPFGKFAYVVNSGDFFATDGSVATYTINATTGALTSNGRISGNCPGLCVPVSVAVDPSGKFAYVTNGDGISPNNVAMYTINATTGALTPIGTIGVGGFAQSVVVDPSGKFAYVATESFSPGSAGNISMYTINATTGILTSIGTIAAGINPVSVVVDPTGKFAYVTNSGSDISMYTIDTTTGGLSSIGTITVGGGSIAIHPSGKFVYVSNSAGSVSIYSIDATTGTLTFIGTTGAAGSSIAIHPSGKFAYVTNSSSNDVSMYSIDATTGIWTLIGTIGS